MASKDPIDLSEFTAPTRVRSCKIRTIKASLSDEQNLKLDAAMALPMEQVTHHRVTQVLASWGHSVSGHVVRSHRHGECSCE